MTTTWLLTGATGMLGEDVLALLRRDGETAVGLARSGLDITDADAVHDTLDAHRPRIVVNCAAWTAIDDAEALRVNGDGPGHLAAACAKTGARLIQLSTDYVFAGDATAPYPEDGPTVPRGAYGRTKLAGERAVRAALPDAGFVVRTAWLLGADPARVRPTTGTAFVRPAPRPAYGVLGHDGRRRAGIAPIRPWREALERALPTLLDQKHDQKHDEKHDEKKGSAR